MRVGPILHQQIFQLKWHFLACVALIMVLPLEEAAVNLGAGEGFYSFGWAGGILLLTPLLGALLACANVQADLDEKRYLFWRSKPAGVWAIVSLKYLVGLGLALAVLACPLLFVLISTALCAREEPQRGFFTYVLVISMIVWLAYSISFLTNVLVRRTARAWLIGMALTCFVLLIPFILPLGIKDIVSDVSFYRVSAAYSSILLGVIVLAFILAVLGVKHDWHLRTNLKGLLWSGAGLIFGLMLLFSGQVANIRILDELGVERPKPGYYIESRFKKLGHRIVIPTVGEWLSGYEVVVSQNRISLSEVQETLPSEEPQHLDIPPADSAIEEGLIPGYARGGIYHTIGEDLFYFSMCPYYVNVQVTDEYGDIRERRRWKKVLLRSFRMTEDVPVPQSSLDLSDCILDENYPRSVMCLIETDLIVARIHSRCMAVRVSDKGDLRLIERNTINNVSPAFVHRNQVFTLPLFPLDSVGIRDRIRLSIDAMRYGRYYWSTSSLIHTDNDNTLFAMVSRNDIARYDVIKWDQESIYCQFRDARPFTFLEQRASIHAFSRGFVQGGNLYVHEDQSLMVFDIGTKRAIRKLGHFERISNAFSIEDIEVLDNGNILILAHDPKTRGRLDNSSDDTEDVDDSNSLTVAQDPNEEDDLETPYRLYLLENPR